MPRPWRCRRLCLASLLRFPGPATRHPLQTDSEYSTGGRVRTGPARRLSMFGRPWRLRCSQSFTPGSKRLLVTGALPATLSLTHPASDLDVSGHRPLQKTTPSGASAAHNLAPVRYYLERQSSASPTRSPGPSMLASIQVSLLSRMSTLSDGLRQSDRVSFRMPVEASWVSLDGQTLTQTAETMLVSRNGGVLRLTEKLSMGHELHLRRHLDGDIWKNARARVVAEIDQDPPNHFLYAIHLTDPRSDFSDIDFPSPHKADEALARLLMECSFCQRREVVYLNELQLKSFEVRKCVARHCRICDSPSIWIESLSELRNPDGGTGLPAPSVEDRGIPRPNPARIT